MAIDRLNERARVVRPKLLRWYRDNKRDFPWRRTNDPYVILVSEIMLQQTQAPRVALKLPDFIAKFPSFTVLARATRPDVIRAWQGLGYNNRAVRLHELSRKIGKDSIRSRTVGQLLELPGIGEYTAHAVSSFAFGRRVPVVDVNVRRVVSRIFFRLRATRQLIPLSAAWDLAERILPRKAYDWNQALMEFGATVCTARNPDCAACPVSDHCASRGIRESTNGVAAKRTEPTYGGVPRRIWRGRIVEALRDGPPTMAVARIGKIIKPDFRRHDMPWLTGILAGLERDGIISIITRRGARRVELSRE